MVCCEEVSPSQLDKYSAILGILQCLTNLGIQIHRQVQNIRLGAQQVSTRREGFQPRVTHAPQ